MALIERIRTGHTRILSVGFDLLVVYLVLSIRWMGSVKGDPNLAATADLPSWWWEWGNLQDWLLIGPDAGNWAANAEAWSNGGTLDSHRLPVYSMLTAWFSGIFGDIVFAGHMVNHLLSAMLALGAYTIGRLTSGRAVAVCAAFLTAWSPELFNNQLLFGVDPTLQFSVLLLATCSAIAMNRAHWAWIVLWGVSLGWAISSHYLCLLFVPPATLCLLLMEKNWSTKVRWTLAGILIGLLSFKTLASGYNQLSVGMIANVFTEGVAGSDGRVLGDSQMSGGEASGVVWKNLPTAPRLAVQRGLRSMKVEGAPWLVLLGLFWIGLLGWGLGSPGRSNNRWNWRHTLFFVAFLSPLIGLEASRAPDRYALFSRPLFFLVVARGAVSSMCLLEEAFHRRVKSWRGPRRKHTRAFLSAIIAGCFLLIYRDAFVRRWEPYPPTEEGLADRKMAKAIQERFEFRGDLVSTSQSLAFFTGRDRCPGQRCPTIDDLTTPRGKKQLAACLETIDRECQGGATIPYVLSKSQSHGLGDQRNTVLDFYIEKNFSALSTVSSEGLTQSLHALDRRVMRRLTQELKNSSQ